MKVYLNYRVRMDQEIETHRVRSFFEALGCEVKTEGEQLFAFGAPENHNVGDGVETVYIARVKHTYERLLEHVQRHVALEGTIDTSETAGEYMDFCVFSDNGQIKVKCSPWYMEICMDDIDDYESFCDIAGDCTEEEYAFAGEKEFVYILETAEGEELADDIPLYDCEA